MGLLARTGPLGQEVHLRNSVEALRWYERTRRTTRTDAEGRYELTGLGAVPHILRAYRNSATLAAAAASSRVSERADRPRRPLAARRLATCTGPTAGGQSGP